MNEWRKNPPENLEQRIASWLGHAQQADTRGLRRALKVGLERVSLFEKGGFFTAPALPNEPHGRKV